VGSGKWEVGSEKASRVAGRQSPVQIEAAGILLKHEGAARFEDGVLLDL
jgi:hypothetical protein